MQASQSPSVPPEAQPLAKSYLYWTGCAANYDARIAAIVRATTRVIRAAGIEVTFLGEEEACTGDAARRLGEEGLFQQLALQNIATLERHGVQRIVTHCAHCFHVLKNEYPRFGAAFEVWHHSELIAQILREELVRLKPTSGSLATLHDSCYVGRYNGIFDAPREILRAVHGTATVEMPRHREQSFCCGAGGANYWYDAPKKEPAGVIRIREAVKAGAQTVVAECPFCIKMLEQGAQSAVADGELKIRDIAEIVAEALDEAPAAAPLATADHPQQEQLEQRS
jgi:heterodisulfide reductase subunit D